MALMSAAFGENPRIDLKILGVDAVLGKPMRPELLLETVKRLALSRPVA
jgi:hypothetical protein